tara:strand:- start:743 stop:1405 length:663 start_codon:yes stop_codon:yes gene_type:complete
MKKIVTTLMTICLTLSMSGAMAKEPQNLAIAKKAIVQYHDSGTYDRDINHVIKRAKKYIKLRIAANRTQQKKLAIVLDIDETSLSNYSDMRKEDFGGTYEEITAATDQGKDPAIEATLALYKYAKANNIAVFFVTGRHEPEREITAKNLRDKGYEDWDGLVFRDGEYNKTSAVIYKTAIRKQLISEGYDIIANIGDQKSDLQGGYADKTFKLPNPYYLIS